MRFRWRKQELKDASDERILLALVVERKSDLNIYSPFCKRLTKIEQNLQSILNEQKTQEDH